MSKKAIKIIIGITLAIIFIAAGLITYFVYFSEDKLVAAVDKGDAKAAVSYYNEHVAKNEKKVKKYKDIFSKELDDILKNFTDTKTDFKTAEAQIGAIKALNILKKADETYEKIILLNDSRMAMAAGEEAEKTGDHKQAITEFRKVTEQSDILKSKLYEATENYKSDLAAKIDNALNDGDYETAKALFAEIKEMLPDDAYFFTSQEQKIINLLQTKINVSDVYDGIAMFNALGEFISNRNTFDSFQEKLGEAKDWADHYNKIEKARAFIVGKWKRADGSTLDGMVVECSGVDYTDVGTVIDIPDTDHGFEIGDSKWSCISVKDENTIEFTSMIKSRSGIASYCNARMEFDRSNNTINITCYDINKSSYGQTQTWVKIE